MGFYPYCLEQPTFKLDIEGKSRLLGLASFFLRCLIMGPPIKNWIFKKILCKDGARQTFLDRVFMQRPAFPKTCQGKSRPLIWGLTIKSGFLKLQRTETAPCFTNSLIYGKNMPNIFCYCSLFGQHLDKCCISFLHCPGKVNTSTRTLHIALILAWHYHLQRQRAQCWAVHYLKA